MTPGSSGNTPCCSAPFNSVGPKAGYWRTLCPMISVSVSPARTSIAQIILAVPLAKMNVRRWASGEVGFRPRI